MGMPSLGNDIVVRVNGKNVKLPSWFPLNDRTLVFHVMKHCTVKEWLLSLMRLEKPSCYGTLLGIVYKRCRLCPYRRSCSVALEKTLEKYFERIIYEELG